MKTKVKKKKKGGSNCEAFHGMEGGRGPLFLFKSLVLATC